MKKTWFISRHDGAITWAKKQSLPITDWAVHLDLDMINPGDVVMGTLPIHIAAQVCEIGATFYFLQVNTPFDLRGKELTQRQMMELECKLTQFTVFKLNDYDNQSSL